MNEHAVLDAVYDKIIRWLSVDPADGYDYGGISCINYYRKYPEWRRPDGDIKSLRDLYPQIEDEQYGLVDIIDISIDSSEAPELHAFDNDGETVYCQQIMQTVNARLLLEVFRESGETFRADQKNNSVRLLTGELYMAAPEDELMNIEAMRRMKEYTTPYGINGPAPLLQIKAADTLLNNDRSDEIKEQIYESYARLEFPIQYCRKVSRILNPNELIWCLTYCNKSVLCVEPPNECE